VKRIKTSKFSLLLIVLMLILVSISIVLILKTPKEMMAGKQEMPFKADQLLIKVLIKSHESFKSPLNIMDVSNEEIPITLEPKYLSDVVSLSENSFTLKPGQTKTVYINFRSFIEEKNITHEPGAYVGALLVSSGEFTKQIPMIVEIETKDVLFDANLEISAKRKEIPLGSYSTVQVTLFNLKRSGLTNVKMDYFVKDIMGNIIMTERETVVVETQATFTKTIEIPDNFNPGDYIFVAQARYGGSVGTSTILFKIPEPEEKGKGLIPELRTYCKTSYCWIGLVILAISALVIIILSYFYAGSFLYDKIRGLSKKKEEKKELPKEKEETAKEMPALKAPPQIEKELPKEEIEVIKKPEKKPKPKKALEKKKLKEKLKEWKAKGYDTRVLEEKLEGL